ncbi:MAG: RHS repeat protein, partial [Anaerolineales bacterium]|nr:RHS repeat protein [Anaerolineales bacterium]
LGFVLFEPEGTSFSQPVTWTIAYTGSLPVGTYVPCFYWIEDEARWGEPVDGEVVDLGNGELGLRAVLPHFSAYGFAPPPPPELDGPEPPPDEPDEPEGPEGNRNKKKKEENECGSALCTMSGELVQTVGTQPLPSRGGLPLMVSAAYRSFAMNAATDVREVITSTSTGLQYLTRQDWEVSIAGRSFTGSGFDIEFTWDGRDANGQLLAPGVHQGTTTVWWDYFYQWTNCSFPTPPYCRTSTLNPRYIRSAPYYLQVRRSDLSPTGRGWFGTYDTLLVDRGGTVSILEGDGRTLVFTRRGGGYVAPRGEFSTLTRLQDNSWRRTYKNGAVMTFNANGRLTGIRDRYGNGHTLYYESNGQTIPPGSWGLSTRIRRVSDGAGSYFDYAYGGDGWLDSITDSAGRVYRYEHDGSGFLTAFVDPLGQRETFTYDANGMMTGHTDVRGFSTGYQLDNEGRVIQRTWPTGTDLTLSYTPDTVGMQFDNGTFLTTTLDADFNPIIEVNGVYTVVTGYDENMLPTTRSHAPTTILYDQQGNVLQLFTGTSVEFEYNAPYNQVSRMIGSDGTDTTYEYDALGNLIRYTDVLSQQYSISYDAYGQPLQIVDPLGHTTGMRYDNRGQLTAITDGLGSSWQLVYDAAGNPTRLIDAAGRQTDLSYDALNRLTASIDALSGASSFSYDAAGNLTQVTDPTGRLISYVYDSLNRLTAVTYADGGSESYTYDPLGNLLSWENGRGELTQWQYDGANRVTQMAVQNGPTVGYTYDDLSQLTGLDDGDRQIGYTYLPGTVGYLARETQVAAGLPVSYTIEYDYGSSAPGGQAAAAAVAPAPDLGNGGDVEADANADPNGVASIVSTWPGTAGTVVGPLPRAADAAQFGPPTLVQAAYVPPEEAGVGEQLAAGGAQLAEAWAEDAVDAPLDGVEEAAETAVAPAAAPVPITRTLPPPGGTPTAPDPTPSTAPVDTGPPQPYREVPSSDPGFAQINVSGTITQNTTWTLANSPYVVVGSVTVVDGVTLTVEPGVAVRLNDYVGLVVAGNLSAAGTAVQPISFSSNGANGYWYLQLGGGSILTDTDSSVLNYVSLDGGGGWPGEMLYVYYSDPILDHLTVANAGGDGIRIDNSPGLTLTNSSIGRSAGY